MLQFPGILVPYICSTMLKIIFLTDVLEQEDFQMDPDHHPPTSILFALKINFRSGDSDSAGNSVVKLEMCFGKRGL